MRGALWRPLLPSDLPRLGLIEAAVHPGLPERPEVMAEKLALYPEGCRALVAGNDMLGYAIAHPWWSGRAPRLDEFFGALPAQPECLHMHDVALLPEARGRGAARAYVRHLEALAQATGIGILACVSVYGTAALWGALGFRPVAPIEGGLASYPFDATYMQAEVRGERDARL